MITLRFVSHPGIFNWMCRWLAQGGFKYTHVELKCVAADGSISYIGAMSDGVKARPDGYDAGKVLDELFVNVDATPDQAEKFEGFMGSQIGKPYDYGAVFGFFWPSRDWQEYDHWDCSEAIGTGFTEIGKVPREKAIESSRLTVLGAYLFAIVRTGVG